MSDLLCFVPAPGTRTASTQRPQAAIVARVGEDAERSGYRHCYLQDGGYGGNLGRYADRVELAAGRLLEKYPTVAQRLIPVRDMVAVARFDVAEGQVVLLEAESEALLSDWLEQEPLDEQQLMCSGARYQMRRDLRAIWRSPDPSRRAQAQMLARQWQIDLASL